MFKIVENQYIVVAYHYVRDVGKKDRGIKACSVERFKKQIKEILKFYKIVLLDELYKKVQRREDGFWCSLTFEDGFLDHYSNVLPVFKELKITGTFFPITMTLGGEIPITHKVHILLSKISVTELVRLYERFIQKEFPELVDKYSIPRDRRLKRTRIFDDILTANFKEIITILPIDIKTKFINQCFKENFLNEAEICREFFMNENHLKELKKLGMVIGSHTHTHTSLKILTAKVQEREIKQSKKILEDILGQRIDLFSYPFGDYTGLTPKILKRNGFKLALTNEPRVLTIKDNPLKLPRYDVNNLDELE